MTELHPKVQQFVEMLDEASRRLRLEGEVFWAEWMEEAARRTRKRDLGGVQKALQGYGGMGSFNDLILGDKRLQKLRSEIWKLGRELEREEYEAEMQERQQQ